MSDFQPTIPSDIAAFLDLFVDRFGAANRDSFFDMFEADATTVGTRAEEVSFGIAGLKAEVASETDKSDRLAIELSDPRVKTSGPAAFVFSPVMFRGSIDGETFRIAARLTLGLLRDERRWKIAQLHVSVADSNEPI